MKNQVTAFGILKVLESGSSLSVKQIAELANIDSTFENSQKISHQLYDFIEEGFVKVSAVRNIKEPWRSRRYYRSTGVTK
jgi:hypothetical protein